MAILIREGTATAAVTAAAMSAATAAATEAAIDPGEGSVTTVVQ
jgi:hypothetical protein